VSFYTGLASTKGFSGVSAAGSSVCLRVASGVGAVGFYTGFTLVEGFSEV